MALRRKPKQPDLPKISRLEKMSNLDLASWAENCLVYSCQAFDSWRYNDGPLSEALKAAEVYTSILNELKERAND